MPKQTKKRKKKYNPNKNNFSKNKPLSKQDKIFAAAADYSLNKQKEIISNTMQYGDHVKSFSQYYEYSSSLYEKISSEIKISPVDIELSKISESLLYSLSKCLSAMTLASLTGAMDSAIALLYRKSYECSMIMELHMNGKLKEENIDIYLNRILYEVYEITVTFNKNLMGEKVCSITEFGNKQYKERLEKFAKKHNYSGNIYKRNVWALGIVNNKKMFFKNLLNETDVSNKKDILMKWKELSKLGHNSLNIDYKEFNREEYILWPMATLVKYARFNNIIVNPFKSKMNVVENVDESRKIVHQIIYDKTESFAMAEIASLSCMAMQLWFVLEMIYTPLDKLFGEEISENIGMMLRNNFLSYEMGYKNASGVYFRNIIHFLFKTALKEPRIESDKSEKQYFERLCDKYFVSKVIYGNKEFNLSTMMKIYLYESNSYVHPATYEVYSSYSVQESVTDCFIEYPIYALRDIFIYLKSDDSKILNLAILLMNKIRKNPQNRKVPVKGY